MTGNGVSAASAGWRRGGSCLCDFPPGGASVTAFAMYAEGGWRGYSPCSICVLAKRDILIEAHTRQSAVIIQADRRRAVVAPRPFQTFSAPLTADIKNQRLRHARLFRRKLNGIPG
jgi:hypothetical protein